MGSKLTNSWKRINGSWYYFGADGAMTTGWKYVDGYKFYFGTDGKMVQDVRQADWETVQLQNYSKQS